MTGNDAFEPELVRHAFSWTQVDLGLLVFGQEMWEKLSSAQGLLTPNLTDNPLKKYFSKIKGVFFVVVVCDGVNVSRF